MKRLRLPSQRRFPSTRTAVASNRPLTNHRDGCRSFSSEYYLSPWHFLSPWHVIMTTSSSTAAATTTTSVDDDDVAAKEHSSNTTPCQLWETTSLRLIHSDIGSLDSFHLHEAERAIRWWSTTTNSSSSSSSNTAQRQTVSDNLQTVSLLFQLLDRLCDELVVEEVGGGEDGTNSSTMGADILTYEVISLAVNKWRHITKDYTCCPNNNNNQWSTEDEQDDEQDYVLSPEQMVQNIETYATVSPYFRPDAAIFNMILDVIGKQFYAPDETPAQVQSILQTMKEKSVAPTSVTYTSAIHALASMPRPDAADQALAMFQLMKQQEAAAASHDGDNDSSFRIRPTQSAYGSVIGALAKSVRFQPSLAAKTARAQVAEGLAHEMEDDWGIVANTLIYSRVLHAWAQTTHPQAGQRAQRILDSMLERHYHHPETTFTTTTTTQTEDDISCKPNNYCFSAVMTAHAKNGNVAKVNGLLHQLQYLYEQSSSDADLFPNVFCFNALIEAWVHNNSHRSGSESSSQSQSKSSCAQHAESVLGRMESYAKQSRRDDCLPNLVSFNLVLRAYAKDESKNPTKAARRALAILEHIQAVKLVPDNISYNCVLECLAKCSSASNSSSKKWAADTAEYLVTQQMPQPDVVSYRNLIRAAGNAERAEAILKDMCQSVGRGVQPDVACFNAVITQWSRSSSDKSSSHQQAGQRAEALWRTMKIDYNIDPDVVTYNSLMDCWSSVAARTPEAADRAVSILRHMQQQHQEQQNQQQGEKQTTRTKSSVKPNSISYTTCIWAFAAAKQPEKAEQVFRELEEATRSDPTIKPHIISYCALISAWAKVGNPGKAQAIFDALVARSSPAAGEDQDQSLRPNTAVYSALLHAWATVGEVERSVAILQEMCDEYAAGKNDSAMPDERCFSAVIGALSRSKHPDAAPQAEACLNKMQEMAESGLDHIRPNVYTYQGVISAWANSSLPIAAEQAERNLRRLHYLYYEEGDSHCRPNVIAYTNTLRAWSRVSRQNNSDGGYANAQLAVERSEALLADMLQSELPDLKPNRITYGTILRTIADSRLPDKLLRAQRIVRIMEDHGAALDTFAREQVRRASL